MQLLFREGKSFTLFPLRVIYLKAPDTNAGHQVLFSVPARAITRAVDRNRIRRGLREAYRLGKSALPVSPKWLIAYIYIGKPETGHGVLKSKLISALGRIRENDEARS